MITSNEIDLLCKGDTHDPVVGLSRCCHLLLLWLRKLPLTFIEDASGQSYGVAWVDADDVDEPLTLHSVDLVKRQLQ